MNEYYAKSKELENGKLQYDELLFSHLDKTLKISEQLIERYHIIDKDLILAIKIATAFHDIGKADYRFQSYLIDKKFQGRRVYHPLLSLGIIEKILTYASSNDSNNNRKRIKKSKIKDYIKNLAILAVASHHTPLHQELYSSITNEDEIQLLKVTDKAYLHKIISDLIKKIGIDSIDLSNIYERGCVATLNQSKFDLPIPTSNKEGTRVRELFVIIQGILNFSDWLASSIKNSENFFLTTLSIKEDFIRYPYDYQVKARAVIGNVFITLPTGSGKTETALCWLLNNFSKGFRIFYTLPTTTTINSMYERLIDSRRDYGLNENVVSRYFSNVDLYLSLEGTDPKHSNLLLYRNFFYTVNVTTPDQLILTIMNHSRYTLKSFLLRNSLIIFDEIHAYDSETFALIKTLIKYLHKNYKTKFCIMSATFPNILKRELSFLHATELVDKKFLRIEYKKRKRTSLEFFERYITANLKEIISLYKQGKKILIVVNIVLRAQKIFLELQRLMKKEQLPITDLFLIHSRFTFEDRKKKERRLADPKTLPKILISTQVIEVSLDIDYDVMFTEACYPDALVQRAGRVNRKGNLGNNGEGKINIFLPEGWKENKESASLPYDNGMLEKSIDLLKSYCIYSELDYITLTNEFYDKSWKRDTESEKRFEEIWKRVNYIYRVDLSDEELVELLRTRSGILTINAYSRTHIIEIEKLDNLINETEDINKRYQLFQKIRMYSINVPLIKSVKLSTKMGKKDTKYIVVEADYDSDLGLKIRL